MATMPGSPSVALAQAQTTSLTITVTPACLRFGASSSSSCRSDSVSTPAMPTTHAATACESMPAWSSAPCTAWPTARPASTRPTASGLLGPALAAYARCPFMS